MKGREGRSVLVTGAAGFIGYHLSERLLARGETVGGLDNLNDYNDPRLKADRLARLQVSLHLDQPPLARQPFATEEP